MAEALTTKEGTRSKPLSAPSMPTVERGHALVLLKKQPKPNGKGTGSGGYRAGGGRPAGLPNKKTRELVARVEASGQMPIDYMLLVMRDEGLDMPERLEAAKAAAPYLHPRLNNVEHSGPGGGPIPVAHVVIPIDPQDAVRAYRRLVDGE